LILVKGAEDPKRYEKARIAIDMLDAVFRDEALAGLRYVVVFDVDHLGELERFVERVAGPESKLAKMIRERWELLFADGWYARDLGMLLCKAFWGFRTLYALAHEFAHHVLRPYEERLVSSFREDLPAVDSVIRELAGLVGTVGWAERWLKEVGDYAVHMASELAADYVAINYFLLLNTSPRADPMEVAEAFPYMLFGSAQYWASEVESVAKEVEWLGKKELAKALRGLEGEIMRCRYPRTREVVHSAFAASIRRWPKEVYLSDPRKYETLFEGIDREELRRKGIPVME